MSEFLLEQPWYISILDQHWYTSAVECIATATAYATCLAVVVLVVRLAFGRWLAPRYRHALWLLVALRLLLPIAPESRFSLHRLWIDQLFQQAEVAPLPMAVDTSLPAPTAQSDFSLTVPVVPSPESRFEIAVIDAFNLLNLSWPLGMLITGGWIIFATRRCRRRMCGLAATDDPHLLTMLEACRSELIVRRRVELVLVPGLASPAQMGLFHPRILLPDDVARDFSADELRHILLHELAHIKRYDVAVNLLLSLLQVVYWWNPVFWFMRSRIIAERELACDGLVVGAIGQVRATSYGRTLVHIVERLSEAVVAPWSPPTSAPGLISFLGRASALKSRLRQLPRSAAGSSRLAQVAAWLLIAVLATTGLTNAKSDDDAEADDYSHLEADAWFNLPQDARWYVAPTDEADEQPSVTVVYEGGALLDRFERDEKVSRDGARTMISSTLTPWKFTAAPGAETGKSDKSRRLTCVWQDDQLVCHGPPNVVTATTRLLNAWCNHGLQQISCEFQRIESPVDVVNKLGIPGGDIVSAEGNKLEQATPATDSLFRRRQTDSPFDVRAITSIEWQYPVYLKVLDGASVQRLREFVQGDRRASLKMSPKVTVFQGQQAFIQDVVRRPFVVGLKSADGEAPTPQIKIVPEGSSISVVAIANAQTGRVRIQIGIGDSRIIDVSTATAASGPNDKPLSVQIPTVENRAYNIAAELASGESLLLHPLEETTKHRRSYILITPRIVTPAE